MKYSLRVATVAGIDINLHASFVLVLGLGAWPWLMWGARGALFGAGMSLLIFACIALHELGHSLVAKAFGIPVTDITLTPIGGVAILKDRPKTPTQELLIAIAGPAVNVVLAGIFWGIAVALLGTDGLTDAPDDRALSEADLARLLAAGGAGALGDVAEEIRRAIEHERPSGSGDDAAVLLFRIDGSGPGGRPSDGVERPSTDAIKIGASQADQRT